MDNDFLNKYEELMQSDVEDALEFCKETFEKTNDVDILVYMGDCFLALNEFEAAVDAIDEGLKSGCTNVTLAKSLKGEALFYMNEFEKSKDIFLEILAENPNSFFAIAYLTDIDINLGNYLEGVDRAEKILKNNNFDAHDTGYIKANIGWIKLKYLNNPSSAILDFKEALELDASLGSPYIGLGEYYLKKEEYQKALESFENAMDLGENTLEVYLGIGFSYKGLKLNEDALEYFKVVHDADPENEIAKMEIAKLKS